ncbi:DnaB-like helicase C-terminal domain-containing protein [Bradyrhizobium elkanii]|uniref:DnaB-like helicase C-terminal domain-containing protein n=1 Tax=Bradyrhizobium elkanii TaxID=29448 RepID=UPI00040D7037|nr:DnaB-like helicase C-terminal domain-containing protein [Bradyrhizobium elkanii]
MGSSSTVTTVDFTGSHRTLAPSAVEWARAVRKISQETLAKLPVASGTAFFPDLQSKSEALFFRYPDGWKARSYPAKAFTQKQGTSPTFWNLAAVLDGPLTDVYIVEGELDVCALVECSIAADQVLGAPSASGDQQYVRDALAAGLNRAKRFIWCGDQDKAGLELRSTMAQLFGTAKFYFIDWPEGSKDANDHLRTDGAKAVHDLVVDGSTPWPAEGLFRMAEIPEPAPMTTWDPGFNWGRKCMFAAGTLSVTTGHPGMGKTLLFGQIWYNIVQAYGLLACVASFETRAKPHIRRQLRTLHSRKLESILTGPDIAAADRWINDHYLFLIHPERRPTLAWLLQQAETAVVRYKANILQVDPWNRLEASREPRESETDYIGRCLRELYNFATDFNVHVQILAHPAKMETMRRSEPPELEHIAGSKHWDNMVDQRFVVHRPRLFNDKGERETYVELHHKKARFDELGYATKFALDYDIGVGRFGVCELKQKRKSTHTAATMEDDSELR